MEFSVNGELKMLYLIKNRIKKTMVFKQYLFIRSIGTSLYLVNWIYQKILRIDPSSINKCFTSRCIASDKIIIQGNCVEVRKSLAVSGGCYFQATHGIEFGQNTIWSFNVTMVTSDHDLNDLRLENTEKSGPIKIGGNCWIGSGAVILPDITLGDRTIVGANSVVTKSFPEGHVVIAGCPAKIIRKL
jgi:acetyltransferase-like isoleucine patch superfamily enzyme